MGTTTSVVINTATTTIDTVSSYIWTDMNEVAIPSEQSKTFMLKNALKFIYVTEGDHYKPSPDATWTTDKFIHLGSTLKIFKVFRHGDGHIQIFASFNDETGMYDVSHLFDAVSPLQAKTYYLQELNSPSHRISTPSISAPSIYDTNTICGMPMENMYGNKNLSYSKSV